MSEMDIRDGKRTALVVAHTGRGESLRSARLVVERLAAAGMTMRVLDEEAADIACGEAEEVSAGPKAADGAEVVIVVGGDGTLLRAAELARPAGAPLLGVNLGHVGFLAEAEPDGLAETVDRVIARRYVVEQRMTVDITVWQDGTVVASTWALNEATVEKAARERMIQVVVGVDGRPLSRWGCDGVVCATPTGSTAYAFSAGGPVVWPEVEAMLMVPISAYALFARPMVVSPRSVLEVEVIGGTGRGSGHPAREGVAEPARAVAPGAVMWCDGRRRVDLLPGARVEVRRGALPVLLARLYGAGSGGARPDVAGGPVMGGGPVPEGGAPFADRMVTKFGLPVTGWRGGAPGGQGTDAVWHEGYGGQRAGEETAGGHA